MNRTGGSYWAFGNAGIHKQHQDKRKFCIIKALTNLFSKYTKKRSDWQLQAAQWCCAHTFHQNSGAPSVSATFGVTPSLFYTARLLSRMTAPTPGKAPAPLFGTSATERQSLMSRQGTCLLCWTQENHCLFFFFFHTQSRQSQTVLPAVGIFCTKWELYVVRGSQNPFCEDMDPWVHTDPPATPPAWTCYVGWWAQAERAWHGNGGGTNRRQLTGGAHHQMHTGARLPFLDTSLREGKRREERRWEEKHRNYSHISVPARAPLPIMLPWGRYKQQQKCTDTEKREREITIKTYNYTPGERAGLNTPLPLNTEGE